MKHRLFNLLTVLSLLLCLAFVAVWVQGYWRVYRYLYESGRTAQGTSLGQIVSAKGHLGWTQTNYRWTGPEVRGRNSPKWGWPGPYGGWQSNDAVLTAPSPANVWPQWESFRSIDPLDGGTRWSLGIPCWMPVLMFALLPAGQLTVGLRRRRRFNAGRCLRCGYDLRATPGRCPECGAAAR